jgi:hypothetical protein
MPQISKTFEFYNQYSNRNQHTDQTSITMPQMVNGRKPPPVLTFYSNRIEGSGYYGLGSRTHYVSYTVEGAFKGTCTVEVSNSPNPVDQDWTVASSTVVEYLGLETTGSAGVSGGFSGAVSRPTKTDIREFTGNYAWVRVRLDISRGTLQAIKYNF